MILSFFVWLILGASTAYFANQRGRDPIIWFMIGMVLGILGLILVFILPPLTGQDDHPPEEGVDVIYSQPFPANKAQDISHDYFIKDWFYLDSTHKQYGPLTFEALRKAAEAEDISDKSYVWYEGMEKWSRIYELPGLADSLGISQKSNQFP